MASNITHIVLASKLYDKYFSHFCKQHFYVGTAFPDIRYLAKIDRDLTHLPVSSIEEIQNETNAFVAGLKFHNYVDIIWQDYVSGSDFYKKLDYNYQFIVSVKFFEDELLYPKLTNWQEIVNFFDNILPSEQGFGVELNKIESWHKSLQNYFGQVPNSRTRAEFIAGAIPSLFGTINTDSVNNTVNALKSSDSARGMAFGLYENIESLLD